MKTNAIIRIALFTLGILILSTVLLAGLGVWSFGFTKKVEVNHSSEISQAQMVSADPLVIQNIKIQWAAGNITIQRSDDVLEIQVAESDVDEKDRMSCKISGSTLTIQYEKSSQNLINFGTTTVAKDLVITVPSNWICNQLDIEAAAANVDIKNMTIDELDFDGASGLCNLENCTVSKLDVDAASGDLTFSGALNTLEFDGASADCTLILTQCPRSINLSGMSGELDIILPSDCGFTVSFEGLSSDFSTDFQTTSRNGSHYYGDGSCEIEVEAMSGSVTIRDSGENCHNHHH